MRWLALTAALAGCASSAAISGTDGNPDDADDTGLVGIRAVPAFRLVVEPADPDLDGANYPVQSFGPFLAGSGFDLLLERTVTVSGRVTAAALTPWLAAPLPTEPLVFTADLRFDEVEGRSTAFASTGTEGRFEARVLPGLHTLSVTSSDPRVPSGRRPVAITEPSQPTFDLGLGAPISGRLLDAEATPVVGVVVRAVDPGGLESGLARTDAGGWFELRVAPGPWRVLAQSAPGDRDPQVVTETLEVPAEGVRIDLDVARPLKADLEVRLLDPSGVGVPDLQVRLEAASVDGYGLGRAAFVLESRTDSRGVLTTRVPAGVYALEARPGAEVQVGPARIADLRLEGTTRLEAIVLPGLGTTRMVIRDPSGTPLGRSSVQCTEQLSSRRTVRAETQADGAAELRLARVAQHCTVQPPPERPDLAPSRLLVGSPGADLDVVLGPGTQVDGTVSLNAIAGIERAAWAVVRVLDEQDDAIGFGLADADGRFTVRYQATEFVDPPSP